MKLENVTIKIVGDSDLITPNKARYEKATKMAIEENVYVAVVTIFGAPVCHKTSAIVLPSGELRGGYRIGDEYFLKREGTGIQIHGGL